MSHKQTITVRCIPQGYAFVPKGNVYITANCRKQAQAAHQKVYIVVDPNNDKKSIGIAVPTDISNEVHAKERETRPQRAAAVDRRDASIETKFKEAILEEYPRIPMDALPKVLKTALEKRKGKVGRTETINMRMKAQLAVRAYIRHCHTFYDIHLRTAKVTKQKARDAVKQEVDSIARAWGKAPDAQRNARATKRRKPPGATKKPSTVASKSTKKSASARKNLLRNFQAANGSLPPKPPSNFAKQAIYEKEEIAATQNKADEKDKHMLEDLPRAKATTDHREVRIEEAPKNKDSSQDGSKIIKRKRAAKRPPKKRKGAARLKQSVEKHAVQKSEKRQQVALGHRDGPRVTTRSRAAIAETIQELAQRLGYDSD